MQHFYTDIQGWFTAQHVYDLAVETVSSDGHFVELGCWLGRSTAYLTVAILNSGKTIQLDCVDTWRGSREHQAHPAVVKGTLYREFLSNLTPVCHAFRAIRLCSRDAVLQYRDNSLDFVFIDASHDYHDVKWDIENWLAKVKPGGILAGDDYCPHWPGVVQAVDEVLSKAQISVRRSVWSFFKPA